jgi:alkylation response protein AidB-like acyl-CoA dehydrogenase
MSMDVMQSVFGAAAEVDPELIDALRDSVDAFARKRAARISGDAGTRAAEEWSEVAEAGWLGLLASEEHGGAGLPAPVLVGLYEALGRNGITSNYAAIGVLSLAALECCEAGALRDRLISDLVTGEARPVLCWQTGTSDDDRHLNFTSVTVTGDSLTLSAAREFVEFADMATHFCVPAEVGGKVGLLVIGAGADGVAVATHAALAGGTIATVTLTAEVAGSSFIEMRDRDALSPAFLLARIAVAAQLTGQCEKMIELTSDYSKQRIQFGKPIGSNQVVQHRLVDMWGQKELARVAVRRAGDACSVDMKEAELAALAAKARAGDASAFVVKGAFQLHGAIGYTGEYELGKLARAALALVPWLGSPTTARRRFVSLDRGEVHG